MDLLFLLLVVLSIPVGLIALFARTSTLSRRIRKLEEEVAQLRFPSWQPPEEAAPPPPPGPRADEAVASEWLRAAQERAAAVAAAAPPHPGAAAAEGDEADEEEEEEAEPLSAMFERLVAGRLLIWIGGAAMIGAGFFLIKYSIEIGLLTPQARMIGAAFFGLALLVAGEYSGKIRWLADDRRVAQTLTGAGIVVLYATPYGSHVLYGLIDARTASAAMALVSAAALLLSLRQGAPTAIMGLVGGFLMPALVGDPSASAVPLLVYLTLLNGAVFGLAWRRGWTWLTAAAAALSFAWTLYLLGRPPADATATGFFVIALALAAALLRPGAGKHMSYVQPLAIGLVQLAILIGRSDLGPVAWIMFGLLAAAAAALSLFRREHRFAPAAALVLSLLVIAVKADDADPAVPWAAAAATLLFAALFGPIAPHRDRLLRTAMAAAALAGPFLILRIAMPDLLLPAGWGPAALVLAAAAFALAWLQRAAMADGDGTDIPLLLLAAAAAVLLGAAAVDLLPANLVAAGWATAALAVAAFGRRIRQTGFTHVALAAAAFAAGRGAAMVPELWDTASQSLLGMPALASGLPGPGRTLLSLALPAALLAVLTYLLHLPPRGARRALAATAGLFALATLYVLAKQVFDIESGEDFARRGFGERIAITQALFLIGWLLTSRHVSDRWSGAEQFAWLGTAVTVVAAARLIWFDMFLHNPAVDSQWVGTWPVLNLLVPAYLLGASWLYEARRRADEKTRSGFWFAAFLAALLFGVSLIVRQLFHGAYLNGSGMPIAEVYGYSLAGLLLAVALLLGGMRLKDKAVRLAGLAILTATIVKVFGSDARALEGLLRILSFFGLGLGLIGVALLYGPVLRAEAGARRRPRQAES